MVGLYVDGTKVGALADAEKVLAGLVGQKKTVEVRNEASGWTLGTLTPEPLCPWEPDLTREEIDRRCRESKRSSLDDILKRLGAE